MAKPATLTFAEAAAVPLAGVTALIGVRDLGEVGPCERLLVNGAPGGVGTFAVQIAKAAGAEVTAVCRTRNPLTDAAEAIRYLESEAHPGQGRRHGALAGLTGIVKDPAS